MSDEWKEPLATHHSSLITHHFSMALSVNIKKSLSQRARTNGTRRGASEAKAGEANGFVLDIEFVARPGVTILFGASGSGKTTTLKSVAGILRPDAGRIAVGDTVLFDSERAINLPIR